MQKIIFLLGLVSLILIGDLAYAATNVGSNSAATDGGVYNFTADVTLTVGDGVTTLGSEGGASVTTGTDDQGTVNFTNSTGTTTVTGRVGNGGGTDIKRVLIGTTQEVIFQGDISIFQDFDVTFTADGTMTLASGVDITDTGAGLDGDLFTNANGQGTLNLEGTNIIESDIGSNGAKLKQININGSGSSAHDSVYAFGINLNSYEFQTKNNFNISPTSSGTLSLDVLSATSYGKVTFANFNGAGTRTATVGANTTIDVNVQSFLQNGTVLTVIDGNAGTGVTGGLPVNDHSAVLVITSNAAASADLTLTVSSNYAASTLSPNASNVGSALQVLEGQSLSSEMTNILFQIQGISSFSELENAFNLLAPPMDGGSMVSSIHASNAFQNTILARLSGSSSGDVTGLSSGETYHPQSFWSKGFGSYLDQENRDEIPGYDAYTFGTTLGYDRAFNEDLTLGIAGGYSLGEVDSNNDANTDINSYLGSIYARYSQDSWYMDMTGSFAWHEYEGERNISFASIHRDAEYDTDGQQYGLNTELGYPFDHRGLEVTPLFSLNYVHLDIQSYTETGAGSLNLTVDHQNYDILQSGLGVKFSKSAICKNGSTLIQSIKLKWLYDFIGDRAQTTSTFTGGGSSFSTQGFEPIQHSFNLGAQLEFLTKGPWSFSANYDLELKEEFYSHNGSVTLKYSF